MILLLSLCFGSYSQSKVDNDSIKISVNDVKIINQKLVDAKLAEEQLTKARAIIDNNREQIDSLEIEIENLEIEADYFEGKYRRAKGWRTFWCGTTAGSGLTVLLLILCL